MMKSSLWTWATIILCAVACNSSTADPPNDTGNAGGAGGAEAGIWGLLACSGFGGVGGLGMSCKDGVFSGELQGPLGYCSWHGTCGGDTPLCKWSVPPPSCTVCPGTGGPKMVSIGDSCVDSTEVTRVQYGAWLSTAPSTTGQPHECLWNLSFEPETACLAKDDTCQSGCDDHPQVCVDWCDAQAFCAAVGKRLCGHYLSHKPPWEDALNAELVEACGAGTGDLFPYGPIYVSTACNSSDQGVNTTVAVASLESCVRKHPDGEIFDTIGNVWEWEGACGAESGASDECRVRGGSFTEPGAGNTCTTATMTLTRDSVANNVGFRCCGP